MIGERFGEKEILFRRMYTRYIVDIQELSEIMDEDVNVVTETSRAIFKNLNQDTI